MQKKQLKKLQKKLQEEMQKDLRDKLKKLLENTEDLTSLSMHFVKLLKDLSEDN